MPPHQVELVITDVDGVLTDGVIGLTGAGEEFKNFSVRDGLGIRLLQRAGIRVGFLSSRASPVVRHRAEQLDVTLHLSGVEEKCPALDSILRSLGKARAEACYVGDDLIDIPCLSVVGFPVAVADAHPDVKRYAEYVTKARGGQGAVREVAEVILRARGLWRSAVKRYVP